MSSLRARQWRPRQPASITYTVISVAGEFDRKCVLGVDDSGNRWRIPWQANQGPYYYWWTGFRVGGRYTTAHDPMRSDMSFWTVRDEVSKPQLTRLYKSMNRSLFRGTLRGWRVRFASTGANNGQTFLDRRLILMDEGIANMPELLRRALIHEMAHAATLSRDGKEIRGGVELYHGPRWKREMRRLAKLGEPWAEDCASCYPDKNGPPSPKLAELQLGACFANVPERDAIVAEVRRSREWQGWKASMLAHRGAAKAASVRSRRNS